VSGRTPKPAFPFCPGSVRRWRRRPNHEAPLFTAPMHDACFSVQKPSFLAVLPHSAPVPLSVEHMRASSGIPTLRWASHDLHASHAMPIPGRVFVAFRWRRRPGVFTPVNLLHPLKPTTGMNLMSAFGAPPCPSKRASRFDVLALGCFILAAAVGYLVAVKRVRHIAR